MEYMDHENNKTAEQAPGNEGLSTNSEILYEVESHEIQNKQLAFADLPEINRSAGSLGRVDSFLPDREEILKERWERMQDAPPDEVFPTFHLSRGGLGSMIFAAATPGHGLTQYKDSVYDYEGNVTMGYVPFLDWRKAGAAGMVFYLPKSEIAVNSVEEFENEKLATATEGGVVHINGKEREAYLSLMDVPGEIVLGTGTEFSDTTLNMAAALNAWTSECRPILAPYLQPTREAYKVLMQNVLWEVGSLRDLASYKSGQIDEKYYQVLHTLFYRTKYLLPPNHQRLAAGGAIQKWEEFLKDLETQAKEIRELFEVRASTAESNISVLKSAQAQFKKGVEQFTKEDKSRMPTIFRKAKKIDSADRILSLKTEVIEQMQKAGYMGFYDKYAGVDGSTLSDGSEFYLAQFGSKIDEDILKWQDSLEIAGKRIAMLDDSFLQVELFSKEFINRSEQYIQACESLPPCPVTLEDIEAAF